EKRAEPPDGGIREPEARVERINADGVLREADGPEVRAPEDVVLPLQAVVVVDPRFECLAPLDLRQVDRDILRGVDVDEAGVDDIRRRACCRIPTTGDTNDSVAPRERRHLVATETVPVQVSM